MKKVIQVLPGTTTFSIPEKWDLAVRLVALFERKVQHLEPSTVSPGPAVVSAPAEAPSAAAGDGVEPSQGPPPVVQAGLKMGFVSQILMFMTCWEEIMLDQPGNSAPRGRGDPTELNKELWFSRTLG